ncbi:MAG TPA: hypothetical protein VGH00_06835, partial [Chthoniobacterales bacterium]
ANETTHGRINWARCFDFTGFGFMIDQMQRALHTQSLAIGASEFDPAKPTIVFQGLTLTKEWVVPRLVSMVSPLLLLPVAALFFHRFDPVRTGRVSGTGRRNWMGKIQNLFKPLSRRAVSVLIRPSRNASVPGAIWTDAALTFTLYPLVFVAFVAISVSACFASLPAILPVVFAAVAIIISDVATRDARAGTTASIRAIPRLRENYIWWKFGTACLVSFILCLVPFLRTIAHGPLALVALVGGSVFVAATATALGIATANPKTFIVGFLTFWYVVVNDGGANPLLDFAGFYGRFTLPTILLYGAISVVALGIAELLYRVRLARS